MRNFTKVSVAQDARTELHDKLSLTGAEISVNNLPAGAGVPFVHSHKKNEEIYIILSGQGKAVIDIGGRDEAYNTDGNIFFTFFQCQTGILRRLISSEVFEGD